MRSTTETKGFETKPLTPKELAEHFSVSLNTVYYWNSSIDFPSIKVGKHLRFYLEDVQAYFKEQSARDVFRHCQLPSLNVNPKSSIRSLTIKNAGRADPKHKE